ncbi:MAG: class I SAM-dependent methyltransferase, partial [Actinomycetota bacterium]|nr:class I SAM-dependent methyltransferase [Actinomycetota bacterium]
MGDSSAERIKSANVRYHDAAAAHYDEQWAIGYGAVARRQVLDKLTKALGAAPSRYGRSLEV